MTHVKIIHEIKQALKHFDTYVLIKISFNVKKKDTGGNYWWNLADSIVFVVITALALRGATRIARGSFPRYLCRLHCHEPCGQHLRPRPTKAVHVKREKYNMRGGVVIMVN